MDDTSDEGVLVSAASHMSQRYVRAAACDACHLRRVIVQWDYNQVVLLSLS